MPSFFLSGRPLVSGAVSNPPQGGPRTAGPLQAAPLPCIITLSIYALEITSSPSHSIGFLYTACDCCCID